MKHKNKTFYCVKAQLSTSPEPFLFAKFPNALAANNFADGLWNLVTYKVLKVQGRKITVL